MQDRSGLNSQIILPLAHGECRHCPNTRGDRGLADFLVIYERKRDLFPTLDGIKQRNRYIVCAGIALLLAGVSMCEDDKQRALPATSADEKPPVSNEHTVKCRIFTDKGFELTLEVQSTVTAHPSPDSHLHSVTV